MTWTSIRTARGALLALALAWCGLIPRVGAAQASGTVSITIGGSPGKTPAWAETAGLQSLRDDVIALEARIFDSPDYQHQLLVPGEKEDAFLLGLKDRSVRRLPWAALAWTEAELPSPDLSRAVAAGAFTTLDGVVDFDEGTTHWSIRPQPALVGPVTFEVLRKEKPEYFHAAAKYVPDSASVQALRRVKGETKFVVFFGTWCAICKYYLPSLLKTMEAAANPRLTVEFVGVTEDHKEPAALLRTYGVDATPSFLVVQAGKEVGRITEEPDESVEADLAAILAGR